jgi:1-phosphofructokinase family hexose kinase
VLIAGPNLTTDRTVTIDELRPGEVLRFAEARVTPGGKGVNVARAARTLGYRAGLVGFVPGRTGRAVGELIADEGIPFVSVPIEGEVRSATIVVERDGRITVLNEPGPPVTRRDWDGYVAAVEGNLADHGLLVCIGSAPPGTPSDTYGRLVRVGRAGSAKVLVDAAGGLLTAALEAGPDFVCPNLAEAEGVLRGRVEQDVEEGGSDARERALESAGELRSRGARVAVVTAGRAGVAVAHPDGAMWLSSPEVVMRNPIGAGDSFVAGFAGAVEAGEPLETAAVAGVAAAAASVETMVAGLLDPNRARALRQQMSERRE